MSGELEVARSWRRSGGTADLAEVCVPKRLCRIGERDLVPDVDAVHLEDKGPNVPGQREASAQGGVEVLVSGASEGERGGARRVAEEIDGDVAYRRDVGGVLELLRACRTESENRVKLSVSGQIVVNRKIMPYRE